MPSPTCLQQVTEYFQKLPAEISQELTAVVNDDPSEMLYHISTDLKLKKFFPSVSARVLPLENRSVPRISTAPTLAGCILGYCSDLTDFINHSSNNEERAGRWMVYGFPYEMALKPSKRLLPDAVRTDEHWLVTYNEATVQYQPIPLAKYFYDNVTYRARHRGQPGIQIELLMEVLTETPVRISHSLTLERGFWRVRFEGLHHARRWDRDYKCEAAPMGEAEYEDRRTLIASMLSIESFKPAAASW